MLRRAASLLIASLVGCSFAEHDESAQASIMATQPARDWTAHPAIADLAAADDLYAVSDIHGEIELFRALLRGNHLVDFTDRWIGGRAILVIAGDLIDKGDHSLEVIDLVRALEAQAAAAGGRVVTTLGNHEAEFLVDPFNSKATSTGQDKDGIDNELSTSHVDPASVAACSDTAGRGAWLASLPFGARVGGWFFAHAGSASTLDMSALAQSLEQAVDTSGLAPLTATSSIVEAKAWYGAATDAAAGKAQAAALGVRHIAFGHDPKAFGEAGRVRASSNGILVKLDTAMGIHDSSGVGQPYFLHVHNVGSVETAEVLDATGRATALP